MSRVMEIFKRVRDVTNDPRKERWSDELMFRLLYEGLDDISKQTKMFNAYSAIPLMPGISTYELPKDLIELTSINYQGRDIKLRPTSFMNQEFGHSWIHDTTETDIKYTVFDKQYIHTLRVYPRPFFTPATIDYEFDPDEYGFDGQIEQLSDPEDLYGVISLITSANVLDVATDLYGVLSDITEGQVMLISYIRLAKKPVTYVDDFELPYAYDVALKHFITGMIYRQDVDAQNRLFSEQEMELYIRELGTILNSTSIDSSNMGKHNIQYNGMG